MRKRYTLRHSVVLTAAAAAIAAMLAFGAGVARAATVTWDADGATVGQTDGDGAWLDTSQWWDGAENPTWTSGDDAIFGLGGAGGAVTLAGPTTVGSLTMNAFNGTYTLGTAGQAITLNSGGITVNSGAGDTTIVSPVTLGAAQNWTNNSTSTLTVGAGAVANGANLLTIGGSGNTAITGPIGGTGGLTKDGAGTLTVTGVNTYTGATTVSGGMLEIGGAGKLGNGAYAAALSIADGATFDYNSTAAQTLSGALSGAGKLAKSGAGNLNLSGNNSSFTGTAEINSGILVLSNASALVNAGAVTMAGGTTLQPTLGGVTINAPITVGASGTAATISAPTDLATYTTLTLNGAIRGDGNVTFISTASKNRSNTVLLNAKSSYAGSTLLDTSGANADLFVKLGVDDALPTTTVLTLHGQSGNGSGRTVALDLNGFDQTLAGLATVSTAVNRIQRIQSDVDATLTVNNNADYVYAGYLGEYCIITPGDEILHYGPNFGLTKGGAGRLTIGRETTFSFSGETLTRTDGFTGATNLNAGTLNLNSRYALRFSTLNMNGGTLEFNSAVAGEAFTFGGLAASSAGAGRDIVLENTAAAAVALSVGNNNASTTYAGVLSGAGSLTKIGAGTLTLAGANTYTGATTVSAGTLAYGANDVISTGAVTVNGTGAVLAMGAYSDSVGAVTLTAGNITGSGTLTSTSGFTMNNAAAAGVSVVLGGDVGLTKSAAGVLTLTGVNTYTGATTVSGGTLDLGGGTANGSLDSTVLNLGGGTFAYTRTGNTTQGFTTTNINAGVNTISVVSGNILNLGTIAIAGGTIDFAGTGAGTLAALEASNVNGIIPGATFGDTWAVANGAVSAISGLAAYTLTSMAGTTATNYASMHIDVDNSAGLLDGVITPNSLRFNTAGANTVTLAAGANTINSGGILVTGAVGANLSTITGGALRGAPGADLTVVQNNVSNGLTIESVIADNTTATALTKMGPGELTLSGANTYTGATTVSGGTLEIGEAGQLNSGNYSAGIAVAGGATFKYNSSASQVLGGAISGGGSLAKDGAGLLTLTGVSTYTGAITITTGTLEIGGSGQLGGGTYPGPITISTGATFKYNSDANQTFSSGGTGGTIRGGGSFIKDGAGTLTVSENDGEDPTANLFTGPITINQGTLKMVGDYAFFNNASTYSIASGAVLNLDGETFIPFGSTTINGAGTLLITGGEFYSGEAGDFLTLSLGSGGLIDVKAGGALWNGYRTDNSIIWTANLASLNVDAGAGCLLEVWNGNDVFVDALTGAGTVQRSKSGRVVTLTVGVDNGSGTFSGIITNGAHTALAFTKTGSGTQTLTGDNAYTGATTVNAGTLVLSGAGDINSTAGIIVNGPTAAFMQNSTVASDRTFTLTQGTLGGTGTINTAITSGPNVTIAPGDRTLATAEAGMLTIANAVDLTGGTTEMRLFSPTSSDTSSDTLLQSTTGGLTYGGILEIIDLNPTAFAIGNNWDLFDFESQSGTFSNDAEFGTVGGSDLPLLTTGQKWSFNYTSGVLSVVLGLIPGDTDLNSVVDAADFINLKKNFGAGPGASGGVTIGDFNASGTVNWADLNILTNNMGPGGDGAPATTPEPATLGLLAIGALAIIRRRRAA